MDPLHRPNTLSKLLLFLLLAVISWIDAKAQPRGAPRRKHSSAPIIRDSAYFMNYSKKLNTAGWISFSTGTALLITGYFVYQNNNNPNNIFNGLNLIPGTFMMIFGGCAMITGIALFITATNYKLRANSVSLFTRTEDFPRLAQIGISHHSIPSIGIRLNF